MRAVRRAERKTSSVIDNLLSSTASGHSVGQDSADGNPPVDFRRLRPLASEMWCPIPRLRLRSRCPLEVEQVLDLLDSLHLPRLLLQILDQLRLLDLAPEDDRAVLRVDVDLPLRHVGAAEDLGLDLVGERGVVGLRLLGRLGVLGDRKSTRLNSSHTVISYA